MDELGRISFSSFPNHFISHGHSDHLPTRTTDKKFICSNTTKKLFEHRVTRKKKIRYKRKHDFSLLPSGHTLGSMMLFSNKHKLLYTGDFNTQPGYCGYAKPKKCKTLIIESTFGLPQYEFPKRSRVYKQIVDFVRDESRVIFDAYSFGKAQELCFLFEKRKIPFSVVSSVKKINDLLKLKFRYESPDASVVVGNMNKGGWTRVGCSGWAVSGSYIYQFGYENSFVLSNHADFPSLMKFVKGCNPEKVFTFHGFHIQFAEALRKQGFEAYPLMKKQALLSMFT